MTAPIFFDPTGRRSRQSKRTVAVLLIGIVVTAIAFATTILALSPGRTLALPLPQLHAVVLPGKTPLAGRLAPWLPRPQTPAHDASLSIGFYIPGDDASLASLRRHINVLDWVVPATVNIAGPAHTMTVEADVPFDRMMAAMPHPPKVLPMVQNFAGTDWDAARRHRAAARHRAAPEAWRPPWGPW